MLHYIILGIFLGWGAAVPIGPINLEVIRRNLRISTAAGFSLGLGACLTDLTYIILISLGTLAILTHPLTLKIVGIAGSLILAWFGISALRAKPHQTNEKLSSEIKKSPLWRHAMEGYILTFINPMTILFWSSVSVTIVAATHTIPHAIIYVGAGVLAGTISWEILLNTFLHFTRHRLSAKAMHSLNIAGGIILLLFAGAGLVRAIFN